MPSRIPGPLNELGLATDVTVRGCPGLLDYFVWGYTLPLWADLQVSAGEDGFEVQAPSPGGGVGASVSSFAPAKQPGYPFEPGATSHILKIPNPWAAVTPRGWSTALLPLTYHKDPRFSVLPGIVDTDRYHSLNLVIEWLVPNDGVTLLRAGTPMALLVPFERRKLSCEVVADPQRAFQLSHCGKGGINSERLAAGAYREVGRLWDEATEARRLSTRLRAAARALKGDT
jgi:hypothetical protein